MKVAVFRADGIKNFQDALNSFIKDKKVIDIKYSTVLATLEYTDAGGYAVPSRSTIYDSALVMYEEEEEAQP